MANFPTSYYQDPKEEERRRALLALSGRQAGTYGMTPPAQPAAPMQPAQQPPAAAAPPQQARPDAMQPQASPLQLLAQRGMRQDRPEPPVPELPPAPMTPEIPAWSLVGAGVADLLLNKGRNAGRFIQAVGRGGDAEKYENYKRLAERAKLQSDMNRSSSPAGRYNNPEYLAMRERALELQARNLDLKSTAEERRATQWNELNSTDSKTARAAQDEAIRLGIMSEQDARQLTAAQIAKRSPVINAFLQNTGAVGEARTEQAAQTADATSRARLPYQQQLEEERQANRIALLGQQEDREGRLLDRKDALQGQYRAEDYAKWYGKEVEKDASIAKLIEGIERQPEGVAPTFFERFRNAITNKAIDSDRIEGYQAKHMILELWSRDQSGAAISRTEDGKFVSQVGLDPYASRAQIEAAFRVLSNVVSTQLAVKAAGNPEAASRVLQAAKVDPTRWIGSATGKKQTRAERVRAARGGGGMPVTTAKEAAAGVGRDRAADVPKPLSRDEEDELMNELGL